MKQLILLLFMATVLNTAFAQAVAPKWLETGRKEAVKSLLAKYGDSQKIRIERGVKQVADFWRDKDGSQADFMALCETHFAGTQKSLDVLFFRYQNLMEKLDGHLTEIGREFRTQSDLDLGAIEPFDELFAAYNVGAHINDDFFDNKLAFVVLLNFPLKTLEEKNSEGDKWSRRDWAEVRLAERFSKRIPADVSMAGAAASAAAEQYIAGYNIFMNSVVDATGKSLFPKGLRLLSHWNLRDEIKANYGNKETGLEKQRTIQKVMERIVDQTIPNVVVDNPNYLWNPFTNSVVASKEIDGNFSSGAKNIESPEPDTRYTILLNCFKAMKQIDPYSPTAPTHIERKFNEERELTEVRVKGIFEQILTSPLLKQTAELIEKRLGRKIEPFDIWYNGFKPKSKYTEDQLSDITRKRYPNPAAYKADMPNLLIGLGFSKERAEYLANNIEVDPARGSGHAMGAAMRSAKTRLRTRVAADGMDYKGFNIAVHEMGHNVEQTFSLNNIDYTLLQGVPNTAFTEALAFVFQAQDMKLLGLSSPSAEDDAIKVLNDFWATYEIAGVALVDMAVWRYMYDNPNITPAELKVATLKISKEIWNKYYAPVFGVKDVTLLGIYSHMIHSFLYLPDYPLGHLIAFQIEEKIKESGVIGPEFERVAKQGRIAPDLWMKNATGLPVGPEAMLKAAANALKNVK